MKHYPLLDPIDNPQDLKQLTEDQLPLLCEEIRQFMLDTLNTCGGHFGASMGATELTVALHYVFNTPQDNLVWDVGHQAYIHKMLTGRKQRLGSIRQTHGLAPFPKLDESEYDCFGVGHSSTSISAALGMAVANKLDHKPYKSIAVIGDGAMTAGMAFEALNHAGDLNADLLVILNDNEMSISGNVGALSNYFARMISGSTYGKLREGGKKVLQVMPEKMRDFVKYTETQMKDIMRLGITHGSFFEELGFNYIGPIDGHDLTVLIPTLRNLQQRTGPHLLHIVTKKGKGYDPAESDPIGYHAVKPGFYNATKEKIAPPKTLTYSNIFGQWLCEIADHDQAVIGITPAMREGSDLIEFSQRFPDRYFDVAIAEQHAVTFAAGLAQAGKKPVVAIYSSFLQRAYDQLIHDVAIQNLPVLFAIDRAGIVGGDGSTHNGVFDLSFLRCIPNLTIMAPADENEMRHMLYTGLLQAAPVAVRYPRGNITGVKIDDTLHAYPIGKAECRRQGENVAILAFGAMVNPCQAVANEMNTSLVNMRFVKPLDESMIINMAKSHQLIVTVEENALAGGAGSAVNEVLLKNNLKTDCINLGIGDHFVEHGDPETLLASCGLTADKIKATILKVIRT